MRTVLVLVASTLMVAALEVPVRAVPAPAQVAEKRLAEAKSLMERGQYQQAARACRRAYRLNPQPRYMLWLARIYARANKMSRARNTLARYKRLRNGADKDKRPVSGRRAARFAGAKRPKPRLSDIVLPRDLSRARQRLRKHANSRRSRSSRPSM